jgi:hypothetical protein
MTGMKNLLAEIKLMTQEEVKARRAEIDAADPSGSWRSTVTVALDKRLKDLAGNREKQIVEQAAKPQPLPDPPWLSAPEPQPKPAERPTSEKLDALKAELREMERDIQRDEAKLQQRVTARKARQAESDLLELDAELQRINANPPPDEGKLKAAAEAKGKLEEELKRLAADQRKWKLEEEWVSAAEKIPSWAELPAYAAKIPNRGPGEKPHPMFIHLLQRLSDARNGKRPPARVRRRGPNGKITYETVTEANYVDVLKAARSLQLAELSGRERRAVWDLAKGWGAKKPTSAQVSELVRKWRPNMELRGFPEGQKPDRATAYDEQLREACERMLAWIEPEVLDLVGLPKLIVHGPDDKGFGTTQGFYDPEEQAIHIRSDVIKDQLILHEFGHHVEDQGPVEVWCSMALYLNQLAGEANLISQWDAYKQTVSEEPLYGWSWNDGMPKLPRPDYAAMYYKSGLTELLPVALEKYMPAQPADDYYPEYRALVLPAFRPGAAREAGLEPWTLL